MSDLISRNKVVSILNQLEEHSLSGKMYISNAIYLINNQPTAYDVDNVVEQLEEIRVKKTCNKEKCDEKELCRICVVDDAIEIVKQVGVSDDVCECRLLNGYNFLHKTSCGDVFDMENGFKYCPYCGKKIKVVE